MSGHHAPVFSGIHLYVRDMAASTVFYRRIGLDVPDDDHHAVVSLGEGTSLALGSFALTKAYHPNWREPSGGASSALQFDLPSRAAVDDLYADLIGAGYRSDLAPIDAFWGARYAVVLDPDGNAVGFHSPQDDAMRGGPQAFG